MHSVFIFGPSLLLGNFLLSAILFTYGAIAVPPRPPHHQPGDNVVIVVKNGDGRHPPPTMAMSESQLKEKRVRVERKGILAGLKRQGQLKQSSGGVGTEEAVAAAKKEKSILTKLIPTSARHLPGPSDMFRKNYHSKSPPGDEKGRPSSPSQYGPPPPPDFRPHQPDITPDMQNGKLSLPIGFTDDHQHHLRPHHFKQAKPTPMANKINPYTNGVASSFPPGIDPYEGFIRYAAENLETPMGNIVDYHSLEQYYGPQHPLSLHKQKDVNLNQAYADSFAHDHKNENNEIDNSPPHIPPPPPQHHPHPGFNEVSGGGGFRTRHNPPGRGSNTGGGHDSPNSVNGFEHGIDHFNAPSPGMNAAPLRPRPPLIPPSGGVDPALYEEGHGHQTPPFEPPHPDHPPFGHNHHAPPFKHSSSSAVDENSHPEYHNPPQLPPDLENYDEGPPSPDHLPPVPPPPPSRSTPQQSEGQHHPEAEHNHGGDGGEDGIWGIIDLAEMLQKGQIPGQEGSNSPDKNKPGQSHSPHDGRGGSDRVVIPIITRPPPPRSSSPGIGGGRGHEEPPHPPPHANPPNYSFQSDGYDYDDQPEAAEPGGAGGNFPGSNKSGQQQYSSFDSHEGSDYSDDYKK